MRGSDYARAGGWKDSLKIPVPTPRQSEHCFYGLNRLVKIFDDLLAANAAAGLTDKAASVQNLGNFALTRFFKSNGDHISVGAVTT